MADFPGFPRGLRFTPVPNLFLTALLPQIQDPAELQVSLALFRLLYEKKGQPRQVALGELAADPALAEALGSPASGMAALRRGLALAVARGAFLEKNSLYLLNDEAGRRALGEAPAEGKSPGETLEPEMAPTSAERPNIFRLYEENIGMLTPILAQELAEAEALYPAPWLEEAFQEAVDLNKRNWRYISRILERWAAEGKGHGEARRHPEEDPQKYFKGKYGRIVRH